MRVTRRPTFVDAGASVQSGDGGVKRDKGVAAGITGFIDPL